MIILVYSLGCFALGYITRMLAEKKSKNDTYKEGRKDGYEQAQKRVEAYTIGKTEVIEMLAKTKGVYNGEKDKL